MAVVPLRGGWRDVGLARVPSPGLPDPDLGLVELAVLDARCKTDDILAVKLLRDPRERRAQVVGVLQLEIPAGGFLGETS